MIENHPNLLVDFHLVYATVIVYLVARYPAPRPLVG